MMRNEFEPKGSGTTFFTRAARYWAWVWGIQYNARFVFKKSTSRLKHMGLFVFRARREIGAMDAVLTAGLAA